MRCLVVVLLLCGLASAQDVPIGVQTLRIAKISGLNTVDVHPELGDAVVAHEVDLSRGKVGTFAKRRGFDKVDSLTVVDSIILLEALQFNDGSKYMMVIGAEPNDSGFGLIYVSNEGSEDFRDDSLTLIYSRLPITKDIYVAKLRDQYYVTTGVARGVVIAKLASGFVIRPFPIMAPGEPLIVPIDTMGTEDGDIYTMTGRVRYVFKLSRVTGIVEYTNISYISTPIKLNGHRVYMTHFQWMPLDTGSTVDSTIIDIYRTKSDHGALDPSDFAFATGVSLRHDTPASLSALVYIDSLPDSALSTTDSVQLIEDNLVGFDENTPANFDRRYGAPGYISRTNWTTADTGATAADTISVYAGWPTPEGMALAQGVAYTCAYVDTLTGVQSDTGRSFIIVRDQGDTVKSYTLSLPRPPNSISDVAINLYRAAVRVMTHTTSFHWIEQDRGGTACWWISRSVIDTTRYYMCFGYTSEAHLWGLIAIYGQPVNVIPHPPIDRWKEIRVVDTVYMDQYKLVAQIADTSTTYTDALRYDSLVAPYRENTVPPFLSSTFAFKSRLYGVDENNLYRSEAGDADSWGLFERVPVDPGFDKLTAAWPGQFALQAAKQLSRYGVSESEFVEAEIVGRWGCLAPRSLALSPAGPIFLSANGVVLERDGEYLERTIVPGILSDKLANFRDMSMATLQDACGEWLPREQQYWLCIGDTTYVWDWLASQQLNKNVWTTSSVTFEGGTFYDGSSDLEVVPGQSFYFWRSNDARIFRFGEGITYEEKDYDVGDPGTYNSIVPTYTTGPLLWNQEASQITGFGLLVNFDGAVADSNETILIAPLNEAGTVVTGGVAYYKLYDRFLKVESKVTPALYYQLRITSSGVGGYTLNSATTVEALDVYYIPNAEIIPFSY